MICWLRPFIGLCLALMLTVTGQASVAARGGTVAVNVMVLCTGAGTQVVLIDAEGAPIPPAHICPDCVLAPLDAPPASVPLLRAPEFVRLRGAPIGALDAASQATPSPCARGPPPRV
ncbi:hypothetical protein [Marinovum sp.]|uniref:hypothetical protein n=1 Tax=Marinovum sp. TaxID=2024839 RepID=UPI003A9450E7